MIRDIAVRASVATFIGTILFAASSAMATTLYTETNSASGNQLQVYETLSDGNPTLTAEVATGGLGTDGGLGNQGALALSVDHRHIFAVNAGSNDVSSFEVRPNGLKWVSKAPSGGTTPVSLTIHGDLLYVLNAGGSGNIAGFRIQPNGALNAIPGSSQPLSSSTAGAAQIGFDGGGDRLVVTEKNTNKIDVYTVREGFAGKPRVHASYGMEPFGFTFDRRGDLLVSEAFGGKANAAALSSYL